MKNRMPILTALIVLALLALGVACGGDDSSQAETVAQAAPALSPVAADIKISCTKCHGIEKLCAKIGEFGMPDWGATIGFMMSKGASLGTASVPQAAEYLGEQPEAARAALCE